MKKIFAVVQKNFKRLIRSKVSALVIFLGPFFLITIIGLAFNNSGLHNVSVGTYSKVESPNIDALLESIKEKDIGITKYNDEESCIEAVRNGETNLCIVFPQVIDADNKIMFHVDYSRMNLVFAVLKIISAQVEDQSSKIGEELTREMLSKVKITAISMKSSAEAVDNMRKSANALGYQLTNVSSQLDKMSLSIDFSKMGTNDVRNQTKESNQKILDFKKGMDAGIANNKRQLEKLDSDLTTDRKMLSEKKDSIMQLRTNVSVVYSNLSCVDKTYIFAEKNTTKMLDRLKESDKSDCALLYSVMKVIDDNINDLNNIDKQLSDAQGMIVTAKQDMVKMESESKNVTIETTSGINQLNQKLDDVDKTVAAAKEKIRQLNVSKNNLKTQLGQIGNKISSNDGNMVMLKDGLEEIASNLENVSLITPESIINPLASEIKPLQKNKSNLHFIFPALLVLVIMFVSVLLSSTIVMKEKGSKAFFRNLISPTSDLTFIIGNYVTSIIIVYIQTLVLIAIGTFFFNIELFTIIVPILTAIFFVATVFIFLGMFIGYMFKSEETTTLAGIFLSCILFLFSSTIVPIESMEPAVAAIAKVNPFVLCENILRQVIIFQASPFKIPISVIMISGYIALFALLSFYYLKFSKNQFD